MTELESTKLEIEEFCRDTISMVSRISPDVFAGLGKEASQRMFAHFETLLCDRAQTFINLLVELRRTLTEEVERKEK